MKITPAKVSGFLKEFNFSIKSVLVFGPEEDLLSFKITQLLATLEKVEPFKTIHLESPPPSLKDLPIKEQPTLFGTDAQKRVFIISGIKDKFLNDLQSIHSQLDESCLLILKGISLSTSSKIVKFHEVEKGFFCIGVYEQTLAERKSFVQSLITDYNLQIAHQDLKYLTEILSPDPELMRMEIEKLSLFVQKTSQITLSDIKQTIEPEIAEEIDEFIHHLCIGNKSRLLEIYRNLKIEGQEEMIILRSLTNHLVRLLQVVDVEVLINI
jgi:DNA polymerase-3 subunit delta